MKKYFASLLALGVLCSTGTAYASNMHKVQDTQSSMADSAAVCASLLANNTSPKLTEACADIRSASKIQDDIDASGFSADVHDTLVASLSSVEVKIIAELTAAVNDLTGQHPTVLLNPVTIDPTTGFPNVSWQLTGGLQEYAWQVNIAPATASIDTGYEMAAAGGYQNPTGAPTSFQFSAHNFASGVTTLPAGQYQAKVLIVGDAAATDANERTSVITFTLPQAVPLASGTPHPAVLLNPVTIDPTTGFPNVSWQLTGGATEGGGWLAYIAPATAGNAIERSYTMFKTGVAGSSYQFTSADFSGGMTSLPAGNYEARVTVLADAAGMTTYPSAIMPFSLPTAIGTRVPTTVAPAVSLSLNGYATDGAAVIDVIKLATSPQTVSLQLGATTNTADVRAVSFNFGIMAPGSNGLGGITYSGPTPATVNASASAPGAASVVITIPAGAPAGDYELDAGVTFAGQLPSSIKIGTLHVTDGVSGGTIHPTVLLNPVTIDPTTGFPNVSWQLTGGLQEYAWQVNIAPATASIDTGYEMAAAGGYQNPTGAPTSFQFSAHNFASGVTTLPAGQYQAKVLIVGDAAATDANERTSVITFTLPQAVPLATSLNKPTVTVGAVTTNSIPLSWQPVTGAASYAVLVNNVAVPGGVTGTSYTVPNLKAGTYNIAVIAVGPSVPFGQAQLMSQAWMQTVTVAAAPTVAVFPNNNDSNLGSGSCTGRVSWWWNNTPNEQFAGITNVPPAPDSRVLCYNDPADTANKRADGSGYFYSPTGDWGGQAYQVSACVQKGNYWSTSSGWVTAKPSSCTATSLNQSQLNQMASSLDALQAILEAIKNSF